MATIYHIATEHEWYDSKHLGRYEAKSLKAQGFIHCSNADQVIRVANHLFRNTTGLFLLHINTDRLRSRLVYENLEGGSELFPHVYGPINLDAIIRVSPFNAEEDGTFDHHASDLD